MGLDVVELVMQTEEVFGISLPTHKLERMQTVGDLYTLVCTELALTPRPPPPPDTGYVHPFRKSSKPLKIQWTPEDVWATLVAIIIDQLQVDREEVLYDAYFQRDLGAD
jgi:acyl carrier protein